MNVEFDFLAPPQVVCGWGRRREIGALAASLGRRALIVSGPRVLESPRADGRSELDDIEELLDSAGVKPVRVTSIHSEPEVHHVDELVDQLRSLSAGLGDLVLTIGGGSAIDLGKAAAALVVDQRSTTVVDYLEGVGKGHSIERPPLPQLAVPTTSGTGAEATKNAVISSYDPAFKKSLRSNLMVPRIVLLDAELTVSVPPAATANTGMDAITQLIESFISKRAKPIPRALCLDGLRRVFQAETSAVEAAVDDGSNREAREAMLYAAFLSGLALANSGLGFAHGVAPALGVHCRVPHGLACAVMLPAALRVNRDVRGADIAEIARVVGQREFSSEGDAVEFLIDKVESVCEAVGIPKRLRDIGVEEHQIADLVPSSRGNSMSANPRTLADDELREVLEDLW